MWVSPHLLKFPIYFVGSGGQRSRVFELRPLSYLGTLLTQSIGVLTYCHFYAKLIGNV